MPNTKEGASRSPARYIPGHIPGQARKFTRARVSDDGACYIERGALHKSETVNASNVCLMQTSLERIAFLRPGCSTAELGHDSTRREIDEDIVKTRDHALAAKAK